MKFEIYRDKAKEWRWRLVAKNGKTIADSGEGYKRQGRCVYAIALIQGESAGAEIHLIPTTPTKKGGTTK